MGILGPLMQIMLLLCDTLNGDLMRVTPLAGAVLLADLDQDTVDFVPNFDNSQKKPTVLPARHNLPPHNLGELVDVLCALIHNPEATLQELLEYMPAPDFPTGGPIVW
ncbi:unnamed protein product [Eruca vesicaria subsp. sativa]|uniref:Uncharacterized protein n=1 Tax=Eruca vesicaria subsp. sativa TaxID=29727 RepID=A0ABC8M676_ERUVS|nr:unnamed protein product [Eruca vesicaria subsp. sativa]